MSYVFEIDVFSFYFEIPLYIPCICQKQEGKDKICLILRMRYSAQLQIMLLTYYTEQITNSLALSLSQKANQDQGFLETRKQQMALHKANSLEWAKAAEHQGVKSRRNLSLERETLTQGSNLGLKLRWAKGQHSKQQLLSTSISSPTKWPGSQSSVGKDTRPVAKNFNYTEA